MIIPMGNIAFELMSELGPDAGLLIEPDAVLERQRKDLAQRIDLLCDELHGVLKAQQAKRTLQQTNLVAVRLIEKDSVGRIVDVSIKVMPLIAAVKLLDSTKDELERQNIEVQYYLWGQDGYDLATTRALQQM